MLIGVKECWLQNEKFVQNNYPHREGVNMFVEEYSKVEMKLAM